MRLNPPSETEVRQIQDQIQALKAKLPPREHESRDPLHAIIVKTFLDGASHSRPMDLNNEWAKAGHGIREAIKQGGEVVVRPLYPGEVVQEQKYYPGRERIRVLDKALREVLDGLQWPVTEQWAEETRTMLQWLLEAGKEG